MPDTLTITVFAPFRLNWMSRMPARSDALIENTACPAASGTTLKVPLLKAKVAALVADIPASELERSPRDCVRAALCAASPPVNPAPRFALTVFWLTLVLNTAPPAFTVCAEPLRLNPLNTVPPMSAPAPPFRFLVPPDTSPTTVRPAVPIADRPDCRIE